MNNVNIFNNILYFYLTFFILFYVLRVFFRKSLFKHNHKYISAAFLIKHGFLTLIATVVIPYLIIRVYRALKISQIKISSYSNDELMIGFLLVSSTVTAAGIVAVINRLVTFLKYLYSYINLQQDTLPNNLRHAIFKKEYSSIISYYKLISRSNESVRLSNEEMLTLTAALSKAGLNEDVEMLLEKNLFKDSMFDSILNSSIMLSNGVVGVDKNLTYNDKLKNALKEHNKYYKVLYVQLIALAFVQLFMLIGQFFFENIANTLSIILVIVTASLIISSIAIKYKKLKSIYKKFSISEKSIKIKKSLLDIILVSSQIVIISATIVGVFL
ncbi:hypothetical protein [Staphylococcus haemolyticus]|uniref:hypothetical protein n=1 Tax=Staphylococcus haemolyticus TaxID=1283 RepID=UPI001F0ABC38|nr:hypothetical protein [Staphylococcus haemolyticus]MCH4519567.1 hypothetical protein [Staphylococcus haemolyticus]